MTRSPRWRALPFLFVMMTSAASAQILKGAGATFPHPLYQAWLEHAVLVVRGQDFSIPQFLEYGRRFGNVQPHFVKKSRHPDYPELTMMGVGARNEDGTKNDAVYSRGHGWHTDGPAAKGGPANYHANTDKPAGGGNNARRIWRRQRTPCGNGAAQDTEVMHERAQH